MQKKADNPLCAVSEQYIRMIMESVRRCHLPPGEMGILRCLCENTGPVTPRELCARMRVRPPTVSAMLSRMEQKNLILRLPGEEDRRQIFLSVTDAGRALYRRSQQYLNDYYEQISGRLTPEELSALIGLLAKISAPEPPAKEVLP